METSKFNRIQNYILAIILLVLWGSIFLIHGAAGSVAWALVKLFIAPVGVVLVFVNLVMLIICLLKRKKATPEMISFLLSIILTLPILMLMNIIQIAYPASIDRVQPSITVAWPLNEETIVGWGGDTIETNTPHVLWASERWAYDLVMEPMNTGSKILEDYGIFNKEVIAPVSGTVVEAFDDDDDIIPNSDDFLSMEGNHIYIRIDKTKTYLLLNHLKKGSVLVKTGEHINEGDVIGNVGNSGSTSEPHLHIHHQRQDPSKTIYPIFAEGLPLYFKDINSNPMPEKDSIIIPKN